MASALVRARSGSRHRIQEITLNPTSSKYPMELELLIDDDPVYGLPEVPAGSPLQWNLESYPCDVRPDSKIKLKIIEIHFPALRNRVGYLEYLVSDVGDKPSIQLEVDDPISYSMGFVSSIKQWDHEGPFAVSIRFPDWKKVEEAYLLALGKAVMTSDIHKGPLAGMGKYRSLFKTLIDIGKKVAGIYTAAQVVVERCAAVWEHLEKVQQLHEDMRKLLDGLEGMLPFIDFLKEYATNNLLTDTITAFLNLIEDSSNFMIAYLSKKAIVRLLQSTFDDSAPGRVGELLQEFTELKEDFDRSIRVQVLGSVLTTVQRTLIDRLNPAAHSQYAYTQPCQDGTRQQVLNDINQWLENQNASEKLLWLYGNAGLGKSSIAASICTALDNRETLGAHFFCKRDDPDLRSVDRILNTIVHRLAIRYKAYGHAVSSAIDSNAELPNSPLQSRYRNLIEKPLQALASDHKPPGLLVVVVDALDECEKGDGRRSLLTYLRGLSALLPWIKMIVTSRPDPDIKDVFGKPNDPVICARNAHDYDASGDIYLYTRIRMTEIAANRKRADWPGNTVQLLSQRADGLFIWAATACRFISDAVNVDERLKQIMEGTEPSGTYRLDMLYTTAIRQSVDSDDVDNIEYTRQCIAVIVATASRAPLSVTGLETLLGNRYGTGTLRYVVDRLGSVLYEDEKKNNAVRVYHPSFTDYVLNPARSKELHVDTESVNATLADCCLTAMLRELRFNICGLETSYLLNSEIPDLESRVKSAIGEHLEYGCIHWASHLTMASKGVLNARLGEFLLGPVLLFWIEALSLLSKLAVAFSILLDLKDRMSGTIESYAACIHDVYRFVMAFGDAISQSTPHLYVSALPFAPKNSLLAQRMRPLFPNTLEVTQGAEEHWSACVRTNLYDQGVYSFVFSVKARLLAVCLDNAVALGRLDGDGTVLDPLDCNASSIEFSHDGKLLFCCSVTGNIQVWDAETYQPVLMALPTTSQENSRMALSCNNRLAVSSPKGNTIIVWDLCSSTKVFELVGHLSMLLCITFSPNGLLLASGSEGTAVRIWDAQNGDALFDISDGHPDSVLCVAFSPDSRYIAVGSHDNYTVRVWDTASGTPTSEPLVGHTDSITAIAYSPNGRSVVSGSLDNTVRIWDLDQVPVTSKLLRGHTDRITSLMFSFDGRYVTSGSRDNTMRMWDVDAYVAMSELRVGHLDWVNQVLFSPEGHYVHSASKDNTIGTWDVITGGAVHDPIAGFSNSNSILSISPDCQRVLSWHRDETIHVWDLTSGSQSSKALGGSKNPEDKATAEFSWDSRLVLYNCSDNTLKIHDIVNDVTLGTFSVGWLDKIYGAAFSPCGRFIASDSDEHILRVWSVETGTAIGKPLEGSHERVWSLAFSPHGRLIVAGSEDGAIRVWDVETGTLVYENLTDHEGLIFSVAFSPNSRRFVSASADMTIRIWDLEPDAPASQLLVGHTGWVTSVNFSPDGSLIASGSLDCTVRVWDAANSNAVIEASLNRLTTAFFPAANPSLDSDRSVSQISTEHHPPSLTLSTSYLARRNLLVGWVSLDDDNAFLWLPPEYRAIDDSILQISAFPLSRCSVDFSKFVCGDRWTSVASESVLRYNLIS